MVRKKRKFQEIVHIARHDDSISEICVKEISGKKRIFESSLKVVVCQEQSAYDIGKFSLINSKCNIIASQDFYIHVVDTSVCTISWKDDASEEVSPQVNCVEANYDIPFSVIDSLKKLKVFNFRTKLPAFINGKLDILVYLDSKSFASLQHPSEPILNRQRKQFLHALSYFINVDLEGSTIGESLCTVNIETLFDSIQNHYSSSIETRPISHNHLIPKLRDYQSQAVKWMLNRESKPTNDCEELHVLYEKLPLNDTPEVYLQKYGGFLVKNKYLSSTCRGGILSDEMGLGKTVEVLACILLNPRTNFELINKVPETSSDLHKTFDAETKDDNNYEQGTENENFLPFGNNYSKLIQCVCGDTYSDWSEESCSMCGVTQHLECVLAEPQFSVDYVCPNCIVNTCDPVPSGATLIVSPASILYQWEQEISKHIAGNCLKVFMYHGVTVHKFIDPKILANYDVVLTAYETFRKELDHANIPHGDAKHLLRCPKRFITIPSPLPGVEWWRICLDEAQVVECVNSKISQMASKLHSVNRWCVTGTPVQKSIQDLYGIMVFLRFDPYHEKIWWQEVVKKPYSTGNISKLSLLLNKILWRTTKKSVLDQIGIPKQHVVMHRIELSSIEKVNYSQKHSICRIDFLEKITKYQCGSEKLRSLDRSILSKIMLPLRKLQQVCSYFENISVNSLESQQKKVSMSELLKHLLKKGKYDCEEAHRKYIMSMNGVAGILFIKEDYGSSINTYQDVLKSVEDHKENIRTDVSQVIHALHNLSRSIVAKSNKEGQDETFSQLPELEKKISELQGNYLSKYISTIESSKKSVDCIWKDISDLRKSFKLTHSQYPTSAWWASIYENLEEKDMSIFIERIQELLNNAPGRTILKNDQTIIHCLESSSLLSVIFQKSKDLYDTRLTVVSLFQDSFNSHSDADVQVAVYCHLRPDRTKKSQKCKYCKADSALEDYEAKLFRFDQSTSKDEVDVNLENENVFQNVRRGTHADSELEIVLKFFVNFCKRNKNLSLAAEDGGIELKLIDLLKKEFKLLRNLWLQVSQYIASVDEIDMAKTSARLLLPGEVQDFLNPFVLAEIELEPKYLKYRSEVIQYRFLFKKKLGHLFYLKNLEKAENMEGPFDELCPVCQSKLENSWSVLHCGHCFCLHCMHNLCLRLSPFKNSMGLNCHGIRCPVCREYTQKSEVYYIENKTENEEKQIEIKGSYSTKIQAIIRCLLKIRNNDPEAKSLVFSSFKEFLDNLEFPLLQNGIKFLHLSKKAYQQSLENFKHDKDINVLLIPLNFGAAGINIIEASHVLLVEPVIETSKHQQAIGRIDRIGQNKETYIHKFVMSNTVEENIYSASESSFSSNPNEVVNRDVSVRDLLQLFDVLT